MEVITAVTRNYYFFMIYIRNYQVPIPNIDEHTLTASDFESDGEDMFEPLLPTIEEISR